MFSNKTNINILTALLLRKGVERAVVCPGSRNAPIVHNLSQVMHCTPMTDERSAAFYALGMAQATRRSVVVCVTSGSALLNVAPAAAEAFYQHVPLIILSADRPQRWIDQQDGQTLWQAGALQKFVRRTVNLPEEADEAEQHWHCNRLVNEALLATEQGPVHINVPVSEPLYDFTVSRLPSERLISCARQLRADDSVLTGFLLAQRPVLVIGQMVLKDKQVEEAIERLRTRVVVLSERLTHGGARPFDAILPTMGSDAAPDFVLYMGGTLVSKRLRGFLRQCQPREVWEVSEGETVHDTFMNQTGWMVADASSVLLQLQKLAQASEPTQEQTAYVKTWNERMDALQERVKTLDVPFSQLSVVRVFEDKLRVAKAPEDYHLHYANSSSVRLGNLFAGKKIWVNRGVNGIEGSLSTAVGFSLAVEGNVYCVTGDLSFFYDQNALWCDALKGNLRILLLNNNGGGIFGKFPVNHQEKSYAYIMGENHRTAESVCLQNHIDYLSANDAQTLEATLNDFLTREVRHAIVLEVFTTVEADQQALAAL